MKIDNSRLSIFNLRLSARNRGEVNILAVMVVFLLLATFILGGLAIYYIGQFNKAQTTVDQQVAEAVEQAKKEQQALDEADFVQRQKMPYRTYSAPNVLGAISVSFPKNWNLYAEEKQNDQTQLNLFFDPDLVRSAQTYEGAYALRVTLEQTLYTKIIDGFKKQIEDGELRAQPIKISNINGTRYSGLVGDGKQGLMIVLPVRDKTLTMWTESGNYASDFNKIISQLKVSP